MSIKLVMPSSHLILCHPLHFLPSAFPSIRVFSSESVLCIRWPKYWTFSISPSNEYSGLISFIMDWLDLLSVQDSQESSPTPQFKSIKSIHFSALSFLYSPTLTSIQGSSCGSVVKNLPTNAGDARDLGSIPGSASSPGEGNGNPLQYSCLGKSHGQRSQAGYSPRGHKRVEHDLVTKQQHIRT